MAWAVDLVAYWLLMVVWITKMCVVLHLWRGEVAEGEVVRGYCIRSCMGCGSIRGWLVFMFFLGLSDVLRLFDIDV